MVRKDGFTRTRLPAKPVSIVLNSEDRPEPDVFVTVLPSRDYLLRGGIITPTDMRLVVEISDVTHWRDRNTKMKTYARAGIVEYWVLDVVGRRLFVHCQPTADGYLDISEYEETQSVSALAAPDQTILVADLLP